MFRIGLFLLTNIAIILVASIVLALFGVGSMLDESGVGINYTNLLIICFVFGMMGSFISLLISKPIAKWSTGTKVIEQPKNETERWLLREVQDMSARAGIDMPEVGIMPMQQANAFATGWNRNKALVAVSEGMLQRFSRDEVRSVMGHEIGHVANGDMITLTLIQGVLNTFVMFFARIIGHIVDRQILKNDSGHGLGYFVVTIVMQIVLGILASMIVMWFSRRREFVADRSGAELGGKSGMVNALKRLRAETGIPDQMPESMSAFGITAGKRSGIKAMFMSHPPLEDRIKALEASDIR